MSDPHVLVHRDLQRRWLIDPQVHTTRGKKIAPIIFEGSQEEFTAKIGAHKESFRRELRYQQLFATRRITPEVEFAWETEGEIGMVMRTLKIDLSNLLRFFPSQRYRKELMKQVVQTVDVIHELGFSHSDCNGSNFLVDLADPDLEDGESEEERWNRMQPQVMIIDFENVDPLEELEELEEEGHLFDYELLMEEFRLLGAEVLEPIQQRLHGAEK